MDQPTIEPPVPPTNGHAEPPEVPQPAVEGELRLVVVDLGDPVKVGEKTKFSVTLENDRHVSDKRVRLTIKLPEGVKYERIVSGQRPVDLSTISSDRRTLKVRPIAEMRAGEKLHFMVEVLASRPGKYSFTATVESLRSTEPITAEEDLTINVE